MKIKEIVLRRFKRFSELTVGEIPVTARLVVLTGPNGCGKSSLFEALNSWHRNLWSGKGGWEEDYHVKQTGEGNISVKNAVNVSFHGPEPEDGDGKRKALYVRSAYRNEPDFRIGHLQHAESSLKENRLNRLIDADATVSLNYARLAAQGLEDIYEKEDPETTIGEFREKTLGEIRRTLVRLLPELSLDSLGNPLTQGTFTFTKGETEGFLYKNLSGGEKAAFDLILDVIVKKREFDDTVFCIDEPEAHMSTRLQAQLLDELYGLVSKDSQLWIATHSIGMMRKAYEIYSANPESVVFLDFEDKNFDEAQVLNPIKPNRAFWERVLHVALDDLATLVAPSRVIICEGAPLGGSGRANVAHDARCYNEIFGEEYPDVMFLSAGNANEVESDRREFIYALRAIVKGIDVVRVIDRDDLSDEEVLEKRQAGISVLSRRNIESYLFDDEVLKKLCLLYDKSDEIEGLLKDKEDAVSRSVDRGAAKDDLKAASGEIYNAAKKRLSLIGAGSNAREFMRSTLAPLVRPGMQVYELLEEDILVESDSSSSESQAV